MKKNIFRIFSLSMILCGSSACLIACGGDSPDSPHDSNKKPDTPATERGIAEIADDLWATSCTASDENRMKLIDEVQVYVDKCSKADYDTYYKESSSAKAAEMEKGTILQYYKKALDRVVKEVQQTVVPQGKVALWHLYNMGYVVKTPSHCFGIDLKHKEAARLVPHIEFLCITHQHSDHYSDEMNAAMKAAGKPVYSNFIENEYRIAGKKTIKPADGLEMVVGLADHSAELKNFCVTYQIDCGADTGNKVIYHIGDTYNASQLSKTKDVDIFIPHGGINMNFTTALNRVNPKVTLISHINELGHAVDNYRWPYSKAFERVSQLEPRVAYVPVWGEKIEF